MLMQRCKAGDRLTITLDTALNPASLAGDLLAAGGIDIVITHVSTTSITLAIQAPAHFRIARQPAITGKTAG